MSGTGGSYGFDAITQMGSVLEASAIAGDAQKMGATIEELGDYLHRVEVN
jgi:hypothetical protein